MTSIETMRDLQRHVEAASGPLPDDIAVRIHALGYGEIIEPVETHCGDGGGYEYWYRVADPTSHNGKLTVRVDAEDLPDRSPNAAMALATRALPGCWWQVDSEGNATIGDPIRRVYGCSSPALALVTALIRALIAEAECAPSDLAAHGETR